jgi:hypothetical protein
VQSTTRGDEDEKGFVQTMYEKEVKSKIIIKKDLLPEVAY